MRTASQSAEKFVTRAGAAAQDFVAGSQATTKDQASLAIAAKARYQAELQASFTRDSYSKGLSKSGKAGWLRGITVKGGDRYGSGVAASASKYASESGRFDSARNAAANLPRGLKGSEQNFARAKAVVTALRAAKVGSSA